jgi:hypothetical protein
MAVTSWRGWSLLLQRTSFCTAPCTIHQRRYNKATHQSRSREAYLRTSCQCIKLETWEQLSNVTLMKLLRRIDRTKLMKRCCSRLMHVLAVRIERIYQRPVLSSSCRRPITPTILRCRTIQCWSNISSCWQVQVKISGRWALDGSVDYVCLF